jgi:general secretion pathway protein D
MLAREFQYAGWERPDAIIAPNRVIKQYALLDASPTGAEARVPGAHSKISRTRQAASPVSRRRVSSIWSCMNRRQTRGALLALAAFIILFAASVPSAHAQSASHYYKAGQAAENRDDVQTAYEDFLKAYQKSPQDLRYRTAYERLRVPAASLHVHRGEKLRQQGDLTGALSEFVQALEIDPSNELAQQDIDETKQKMAPAQHQETSLAPGESAALADIGGPIQLKPISNDPLTLHMVQDSKVIYQAVGKAAGINVLFDPDYTSKNVQVDLANVSLYDALRIIGTITGTFWRPVTANTIFVAQNTRSKRMELDEQAVQTFYLSNVSQQNDLNDIQTALRNVFATGAKLYGVASQNAIVMRGTPDEILLAQKIINDLDKARAEVVVDVAVLEVNRDKIRNIGLTLPTSVGVQLQSPNSTTTTNNNNNNNNNGITTPTTTNQGNLTLNDLAHLNATDFAVTISQITANLLLSDSDTRVLQNPRIRASDGQQATLKIGSRIPEATGSFSNGIGAGALGGLGAVQTQFQYIDVGVNIDMKPTVHYDRDVTLKMKIEVSSESGTTTISGVQEPIISQRTIDQTIRLKEGEASVLAGILDRENNLSISGTPGLGELPILKYFFSSQQRETRNDEIVFLLIPHVVRAQQLSPLNLRQIDTGTTNALELRHVNMPQSTIEDAPVKVAPGASAMPASPSAQAPEAGSAVGAAQGAAAAMQQGPLAAPPVPATPVRVSLTPPAAPQKAGSTFKVAVDMADGKDVFAVPMQVTYDPAKMTLINVDSGDFLGHDGQAVALVHRDDGAGNIAISASRPPGTSGVSGGGTVCVLTFQAKAPGDAPIAITHLGVRNSAQQLTPSSGAQSVVHIQ